MNVDIVHLNEFYGSRLGQFAERSIVAGLQGLWRSLPGERLVGLGYTAPYLDRFRADTERTFAFMPAAQGAAPWPHGGPCAAALVFEEDLPLPDSAIDRMLMVHALEHAQDPRETLGEAWRVLAPNGRLVIVVPNRRGVWARMEHTPFGAGRPWPRGQLTRALREVQFTPTAWSDALHFPPADFALALRGSARMERIGRKLFPAIAGAVIVEATKQVYQGLPVLKRQSRRVFAPVLAPQGAARLPSRREPLRGAGSGGRLP